MTWGVQQSSQTGGDVPVSVLLAGPIDRTTAWYQSLQLDARFRVTAMANTPQDLQSKLAASPEIIFLDGQIFPGPQPLIQTLTAITGAVYLLIPGNVDKELVEQLQSIPAVKSVHLGDVNIQELLSRAYGDALALRHTAPAINPDAWGGGRSGGTIAGLRVITVWSPIGGAGTTSLAESLAQAIARRGLQTLLIGLGAPDIIPLHLDIQPEPNILTWLANPTDEGLRASMQKIGDLNVIAGFPDIISESQADRPPEHKGSLAELVTSAAYGGYAGIVMDTPSSGIAPRAVSAANTWILVARPTVADAARAAEAFRTVTQKAAGQHRITPGNIFVVLNQRTNGMLTPDEWHRGADAVCRKMGLNVGFPPVSVVIPYDADIPIAQDNGRSPLDASDKFARPVYTLAEILFGQVVGSQGSEDTGKTLKIGPLKIRTKK